MINPRVILYIVDSSCWKHIDTIVNMKERTDIALIVYQFLIHTSFMNLRLVGGALKVR
jgi:hypothetical protein